MKAEISGVQGQPIPHSKLIYTMGYLRPCQKKNKTLNKPTQKSPQNNKTKCKWMSKGVQWIDQYDAFLKWVCDTGLPVVALSFVHGFDGFFI